jgi:nucleoside-diphosphate-sugar epimerase
VLALGEMLGRICKTGFDPEMAPPRTGEIQRIAIDSSRAAKAFGWRPRWELEDGLEATARWVAGGG